MRKNGWRLTGLWVCAAACLAGGTARAGGVYWSDYQTGAIYRTSGPGGQHELIVPNAGHPWGIAVDPINHYLYWGDYDASTARKITRANLDGSDPVIVLSEPVMEGGGTQFVQGLSLDA